MIHRLATLLLLAGAATFPAQSQVAPMAPSDITNIPPDPTLKNWSVRTLQIPMRDGVKLNTMVVMPRGMKNAPIIFVRTPYGAEKAITGAPSNDYRVALPIAYADLVEAGYIVAVQDVRGRYGSEGDYIINRPLVGPLNDTKVDHSTDAYDSIAWMVKNIPETNGKVGTIGVSYGGFTTLYSMINPHPALKAAVPINPMADGWMGDDWFHNGAYRQSFLDWVYRMSADKSSKYALQFDRQDVYESWLKAGSVSEMARLWGIDKLPMFQKLVAHPAYDEFWQLQALDKMLGKEPLNVPTLHVHSLWDQEDSYGAPATYAAMEPKDRRNDRNYMIIGPWRHGQSMSANEWRRYDRWPMSCASGCPSQSKPIYLSADGGLGWRSPTGASGFAEYVSDPARPVTYRQRPILGTYNPLTTWGQWLVDDQRFAEARPDVVTFVSDVLTDDVRLAGEPIAKFFASTSGTDSDWVVKLIDVYPAEYAEAPEMGGYELAISMDILRGRYRESFSKPAPIPANQVLPYEIKLPQVSHKFMKGHRIMVQIQSTWFPLYDRNPQKYVPNIFTAQKSDYQKATQRIWASAKYPSRIELPVVPQM